MVTYHFYTGIKSLSFFCWTLRIVGQKVSTKSLMAALTDCFPSSSCLLLSEYWNLEPNNNNIILRKGDKDMAANQDSVFTFYPKMHYVLQRKLRLLMPV